MGYNRNKLKGVPALSSQRDFLRQLVQQHGPDEDRVCREYALAETRGLVPRMSNRCAISAFEYARALWRDGLRKGWLNLAGAQRPSTHVPLSIVPPTTLPSKVEYVQLLKQVYACTACSNLPFASLFQRPAPERPYFKFPPVIGKSERPFVLFVGINPRRSDSNAGLHDFIMQKEEHFLEFSSNRLRGRTYIPGFESHYGTHVRIIRGAFPNNQFEAVAAVTELFLCATENAGGLPTSNSPCANRFLAQTVACVDPMVIVTFGDSVKDYFALQFGTIGKACYAVLAGRRRRVVHLAHPNARGKTAEDRAADIEFAAKEIRNVAATAAS